MLFNLDKCAVMHLGFNNIGESMELGGKSLVLHTSERDLGVIVQSNLKVDMQCNKAASLNFPVLLNSLNIPDFPELWVLGRHPLHLDLNQ